MHPHDTNEKRGDAPRWIVLLPNQSYCTVHGWDKSQARGRAKQTLNIAGRLPIGTVVRPA